MILNDIVCLLCAIMDRQELPMLLADYPLEDIYNFSESGLMHRMLATSGNVVGATKNRRGAKIAKDMITIGIFFNSTGSDFWKR